jgi:chromosome segregation protein
MTTRPDDAAPAPSLETTGLAGEAGETGAQPLASPGALRLPSLGGLGFKPQSVRLKSLVLDNFKSFAQRTPIELLGGFTAISGPNGSGKSNLIDAMLFVLGFASSKGLRADRLTDLINSESGKATARVELELEVKTDAGDTRIMVVSRVVRRIRQGESQAHYELDGNPIKMHELHDVLHDLGLPSSGLNVVVQNDVTRITALGEVSRRQILDELAGAQEFDRRIGAANKELGEADLHQGEIRIVLKEIESRLAALETEKAKAIEYQGLAVEKDRLEAELFVLDVLEAQAKARKKAAEVQAHRDRSGELGEELVAAEAASQSARELLEGIEAEIAAKAEGEHVQAVREVEAVRTNVAHAQKTSAEARNEAGFLKRQDEEREAILADAVSRESGLSRREEELKTELAARVEKHATIRREVDLAANEMQKRAKGMLDAEDVRRALDAEAASLRSQEAEVSAIVRGVSERTARDESERAVLLQTLEGERARKAEVERLAAEAASTRRMAREDEAKEAERIQKLKRRQESLRAGLEKAEHDHSQGLSEMGRLDERRKAVLEHGGGRALEVVRREKIAGVHGAVHELFKFDPEHALAIEAAAGARLMNLVVADEHAGKRVIEAMKRTGAGRITCLPINKIQAPRFELRQVQARGVIGYALELVDFDDEYQPIFKYVLSDTLIVETMQTAIELGIGRHRMVTLDGDLLDRSGSMTGGSPSRGGTAFAQAAKLEQELAQKHAALEEIERRRNAARAELLELEGEGQRVQAAFVSRQQRLAEANAAADQHNQELVRLEQKIAPAEARLAQLDASLARARAEAQETETRLTQLRASLASTEARLREVSDSAVDVYEVLTKKNVEREEALRALEDEKAKLHEALTQVQVARRGTAGEIEQARKAIVDAQAQVEAALARGVAADAEAEKLAQDLKKKEKAIAALLAELAALRTKRDEAAKRAQDRRDAAKEVALKLEAERAAVVEGEQAFATLEGQARSLAALAAEKHLPIPEQAPPDLGKLRDFARRELAKAEGKMKALEPVNMLAIEQHAAYSMRKAELDERLATLEREVAAIRARIVELDGAKKTAFLQAFEAVAAAFEENFHELTGGEGWLELSNPESPFEGGLTLIARPKGQKAARLESLSGGEKTLTALAFLFALQKVNPAPFFCFDEVDAALDAANTGRLAQAIRRRASERQYFCVSHRRALVEKAHQAIGVTKRKGVGTMVAGITLEEVAAVEAQVEAEKRAAAAAAVAARRQTETPN